MVTTNPTPPRATRVTAAPRTTCTPGAAAAAAQTLSSPRRRPKLLGNSLRRCRFLKSEPGPSAGNPSAFCDGTAAKKAESRRS